MPQLAYDIVDVFTHRPFTGNALAVVHGAEDLDGQQMHAIAREFNLSETTFPVPVAHGGDYGVRIFTVGGEIPFAGHPTIGTAWVLHGHGRLHAGQVVQECGAGAVQVRLPDDRAGLVELAAVPRDQPSGELPGGRYAEALGLEEADLVGPVLAAGCGLTFVHVPVRPDAVGRAVCPRPGDPAITGLPDVRDPVGGVSVYAVDVATGAVPGAAVGKDPAETGVHARVFCPEVGVAEDPATGSAAAGLGLALHEQGLLPEGGRYVISQGAEVGRPSRLSGRVEVVDGAVVRCRVAGQVAQVASGRIAVPDR
ncbi:MAG TPA: PhzF family phenazine biosynthesis protein [Nocardioidaceae bacterium]|nr:PhzF family phenazine biosynthesis protein [Nocardioidaceae bacterium]